MLTLRLSVSAFATAISAIYLASVPAHSADISLDERLDALVRAFPSANITRSGNTLQVAGRTITIDDAGQKSHQAKLKSADIEDMLSQIYPLGACAVGKPTRNEDPGRIRNEIFLRAIFGNSRAEVRKSLVEISWFGGRIPVTGKAGVDKALIRVRDDLAKLPRRFRKYFVKTGGVFNWRPIAGTKRLSVHSFGAAIDINTKYTDYWRWAGGKPGNVPRYRNKVPLEIVRIFERHGFIWGGKWYHFDTMHFEYRPDLIAIGRLAERRGCPKT